MIDHWIMFGPIVLTGAAVGAGTGLLGVQIVGMRIPLIGVCVSHAAMAGAVFAHVAAGWMGVTDADREMLVTGGALVGAMLAAVPLAVFDPRRLRLDPNVVLGVVLSLTMGLTFLGIGLNPRGVTPLVSLLWGSLLYTTAADRVLIGLSAGGLGLFMILFYKELRAILFSRDLARAGGVHVGLVWTGFLMLAAVTIAVSLKGVGGLMIFALLSNPAAAAAQLVRGYGRLLVTSATLGAVSAVGGFYASYALDLPVGACIVLASSVLLGLSLIAGMVRRIQ